MIIIQIHHAATASTMHGWFVPETGISSENEDLVGSHTVSNEYLEEWLHEYVFVHCPGCLRIFMHSLLYLASRCADVRPTDAARRFGHGARRCNHAYGDMRYEYRNPWY